MLKKIQFRGISRTPSHKMTEDGGCDESVNVFLDGGEVAPALDPKLVTNRYGTNHDPCFDRGDTPIYLHRNGYENLICLNTNGDLFYFPRNESEATSATVIAAGFLSGGETIADITSIGNTIIVSTSAKRMAYFLWTGTEYKTLGDRIPEPLVYFQSRVYNTSTDQSADPDDVKITGSTKTLAENYHDGDGGIKKMHKATWESVLSGTNQNADYDAEFKEVCADVWDIIKGQVTRLKEKKYFGVPVMARYALRLYDGRYIYQSVPILLGAGFSDMIGVEGLSSGTQGGSNWNATLKAYVKHAFKANVQTGMGHGYYEGWTDIVEAVDIFLSTDIFPALNHEITGISDKTVSATVKNYNLTIGVDADTTEAEIVSKSVFFKVASFAAESVWSMAGYDLLSDSNAVNGIEAEALVSQDYLMTMERLTDGYLTFHRKTSDNFFRYNNKLIFSGVSYEVSTGYQYLNAMSRVKNDELATQEQFSLKFYIRTGSGDELAVISRNDSGSQTITTKAAQDGGQMRPYGWIAYPDARCYKVDVMRGGNVVATYSMKGHPGLHCAYAFLGLGTKLAQTGSETWDATEKRTYDDQNIVWASEMDNPFVFNATGTMTFPSKVIAVAAVTLPLSEGQVGQFPLYVFTEEGIRFVSITSTGDFGASFALSADVALSRRSILSFEQAVLFVSRAGVMLLQGRSITCISDAMRGRTYHLPDAVYDAIAAVYPAISKVYDETMTFDEFVAGSEIGYDYANKRVLFARIDRQYMYEYHVKTGTWHKQIIGAFYPWEGEPAQNGSVPVGAAGGGLGLDRFSFLPNSYPECFLIFQHKQTASALEPWFSYIYNMSRVYEVYYDDDQQAYVEAVTLPQLLITRPLDLDGPDIRKIIRDIRIRGNVSRQRYGYILLGSMDGLSWGVLSSLRSGSYKYFRLVVVSRMQAGERISYAECEYDPRFTKRLR